MTATRVLWLACAAWSNAGAAQAAPAPVNTTPDSVVVDGVQLVWDAAGAGPAVVLVSGGGGMDMRQWDAMIGGLSRRHRTLRFEPRGSGRSGTAERPYSNVEDLARVMDAAGITAAALVGVSSGGGIALEFALTYPARVTALVLSGPLVAGFTNSDALNARVAGLLRASRQGVEAGVQAFLNDPHFVPAARNPAARALAERLLRENARASTPGLVAVLNPPTVTRLGDVTCPVLLLIGELDHPDLRRRVEFVASKIPASLMMLVPGAGHMINLEQPLLFQDAVLAFLGTRPAR